MSLSSVPSNELVFRFNKLAKELDEAIRRLGDEMQTVGELRGEIDLIKNELESRNAKVSEPR